MSGQGEMLSKKDDNLNFDGTILVGTKSDNLLSIPCSYDIITMVLYIILGT